MAEQPQLGIRNDEDGVHGFGKLNYEIRNGEVVWLDGGPTPRHGDRKTASAPRPNPRCAISARR